jgi:Fibronectin type III domain
MASPTAPGGPPAGGRTVLGLKPRTALIAGAVIFSAAVGYILWRRHQAAAQPTVTSSSASASGSGIDYGGELSVIQSELEDLLAAEGQESSSGSGSGGGGTGSGTGGAGNCPGGFTWNPATQQCEPAKGEQGVPGTSGGGGGGGVGTKTQAKPGVPTGVHATKTGANSVTLAWNKAPNATSYRVRVTYQSKVVTSASSNGTSVTVSGLTPDHTYTFHVAAVGPGGTSAETNGPAVKTAR